MTKTSNTSQNQQSQGHYTRVDKVAKYMIGSGLEHPTYVRKALALVEGAIQQGLITRDEFNYYSVDWALITLISIGRTHYVMMSEHHDNDYDRNMLFGVEKSPNGKLDVAVFYEVPPLPLQEDAAVQVISPQISSNARSVFFKPVGHPMPRVFDPEECQGPQSDEERPLIELTKM